MSGRTHSSPPGTWSPDRCGCTGSATHCVCLARPDSTRRAGVTSSCLRLQRGPVGGLPGYLNRESPPSAFPSAFSAESGRAQSNHRLCHQDESGDVRSNHVVTRRAELHRRLVGQYVDDFSSWAISCIRSRCGKAATAVAAASIYCRSASRTRDSTRWCPTPSPQPPYAWLGLVAATQASTSMQCTLLLAMRVTNQSRNSS